MLPYMLPIVFRVYGITIIQVLIYFQKYHDDSLPVKILVRTP